MLDQDIVDLSSSNKESRLAAIERLAQSDQPQAVRVLIALLENTTEHFDVRAAAARALGTLGDARAVEPLILAAGQDQYDVLPAAAATALGQLGDLRAVECLAGLLGRWQDVVKASAARALAALGAVKALVAAVNEGDEDTRWAAAEALAVSGHGQSLVTVVSDDKGASAEWKAAARVLADRQDPDPLNVLLDSLKSPRWDVRITAARTLERLADPRSADALRSALGDSESSVQLAAKVALRRIGSPPSDEDVAAGAMKAYAAQGLKVQSVVAQTIACLRCSRAQTPAIWPVRGDRIPFYSQQDPAEFSITMSCSGCGSVWHVVWDSDPGRFYPLQP